MAKKRKVVEVVASKATQALLKKGRQLGYVSFSPGPTGDDYVVVATLEDFDDGSEGTLDLVLRAVTGTESGPIVVLVSGKRRFGPRTAQMLALTPSKFGAGVSAPFVTDNVEEVIRILVAHETDVRSQRIATAYVHDSNLWVWSCEPRLHFVVPHLIPVLSKIPYNELASVEVTKTGRLHWRKAKVEIGLDEIRYFADSGARREAAYRIRTKVGNIGTALRALRQQRGLTQKQLGDLCGLDGRQIRRLEGENGAPRIATLEAIARGLDMSVIELGEALRRASPSPNKTS